jgi:hypothetical protein
MRSSQFVNRKELTEHGILIFHLLMYIDANSFKSMHLFCQGILLQVITLLNS